MLNDQDSVRLILAGGHARATAVAVFEEIRKRHKNWQVFFAGGTRVFPGKNIKAFEADIFPKLKVPYLPLFAGRLQRKFTWWTVPELLKLPLGFLQAFYYVLKIRPKFIVSFGGYAGFPLVVAGRALGVSVVIHEQTAVYGRANLFSAPFAKKILLARSSSLPFFSKTKAVVIGNPITSGVRKVKETKSFAKFPTLFVTGGASGSLIINKALRPILPMLLEDYYIVHQVGELSYNDFLEVRNKLPVELQKRYQVFPTIYPWDWPAYLKKADIVISRAGANITSEIIYTRRPAILIPLKIAYKDEQQKNAAFAQGFGIVKIIDEAVLTPEILLKNIEEVKVSWQTMVTNARKMVSPDSLAHIKFVDMLDSLLAK